jgi:tetratricopeptide (TPR) repeat protein
LNRQAHPAPEQLELFVLGTLSEGDAVNVAWHLMRCHGCQQQVAVSEAGRAKLEQILPTGALAPTSTSTAAYDDVISRTYETLLGRENDLETDRARAPLLLDELLRQPPARRLMMIQNSQRFATWAMVEVLLKAAAAASRNEASEAHHYATLALELADRLDPAGYGEGLLQDLKARCYLQLANTRRLLLDIPGAESAFAAAEECLRQGTDDLLEQAHFFDLKASLLRDLQQWGPARESLLRAVSIYRKVGDLHLAGRSMLGLGKLYMDTHHPERAVESLRKAREWIEAGRDVDLDLGLRLNFIGCLILTERYMEAWSQLVASRDLFERHGAGIIKAQVLWAQGLAARGLGQYAQAESYLKRAQTRLAELDRVYDVAVIELDLAGVYACQGRHDDVRRIALEVLPTFQNLYTDRREDALTAMLLFRQAAEAEQVTVALVRDLAARLGRARNLGRPS